MQPMLSHITYHMSLAFELLTGLLTQAVSQDVATWDAHTSCQVSATHAGLSNTGRTYKTSTRTAITCVTYLMSSDHIVPSYMSLVS
ncbi:Erythronate-4-phosphate dehydrogenase [Gossypium arboreum]|uniref:Erythronate-4-phosphate dehydrogenase n=1 Tax=Gossypium arboreum TaxID=29729 RepID=A0A0B0NMC1_GOSAR|nr:Erythronate-4-phosphate dehydrogenase [Gossypium arboreum]